MTNPAMPARFRRAMQASISPVLAIAVLAIGAAPASAAPAARAVITDGTLQITGSRLSETIVVRLSALDATRLEVDLTGDKAAEHTFDISTFRAIEVGAGAGNDTVRIDQANGAFTTTRPTRIGGGNGDDTLVGGSGAETFLGGNGNDFVDGNGGADTAFLGRGDDVFLWDPGDASDVVEGESGSDTMVFNGAGGNEIMAATASGGRVHFTRNLGTIVMDLNDVESIDVSALGGADSVAIDDLVGTDLQRVDVDLAASLGGTTPDDQPDTVTVTATKGNDSIAVQSDGAGVVVRGLAATTRVAGADPTHDTLVIETLTGADDVSIDPAVDGLILVAVE